MSANNIKDTGHRFSDVAEEPCIMLGPIEGFNKKDLVTLEEASLPLINIVPRISTYVYIAKQRATNPANDLSVDESASIALYTMEWEPYTESLYYILNQTLRTEDRQKLKPWFLYLKLIFTALSRLPSTNLTVYRGVRSNIENNFEEYQTGKELVWWGFSSCSKSQNVSEKNQFIGETGQGTLFTIDCIAGIDISKHSYFKKEQEILLLPATKLKVIDNKTQEDGVHVIHLKETTSSFILLEPVSSKEEISTFTNKSKLNPSLPGIEPERYFNAKLNEYIARCRPRSEIYLIGKRFNENDIEIVVQQLIINKQCRQLFLRDSGITSQGAIIISEALSRNNTLEHLFISHNRIGDKGAKALSQSLSNNANVTLKQLCLGYNGITDEGIEHLATMLESNKTLTHLRLPANEISDRGLKRLAEVLTNKNNNLQVLSLEWNKLCSASSVDILVGMLRENKSLTELNLCSCKLPKTAIKQLKRVVKKEKKNFKLKIDSVFFVINL